MRPANKVTITTIVFLALLIPEISKAQVNIEKYLGNDNKQTWQLGMDLNLAVNQGNTDAIKIDAELGINWNPGRFNIFLIGSYARGQESDKEYLHNGKIQVTGVYNCSEGLSVELFLHKGFDSAVLLKDRLAGGASLKLAVVKGKGRQSVKPFVLSAAAGLMWEQEIYKPSAEGYLKEKTSLIKSSNYVSMVWNINKGLMLNFISNLQIPFSRWREFRIIGELVLQSKINDKIFLMNKINYRYNNNPPETVLKSDFEIVSGFALRF